MRYSYKFYDLIAIKHRDNICALLNLRLIPCVYVYTALKIPSVLEIKIMEAAANARIFTRIVAKTSPNSLSTKQNKTPSKLHFNIN